MSDELKSDIESNAIVGVVAIGRNEGERLRACFESLKHYQLPIVYVDSGSTDGSILLAENYGAIVLELDMSCPFTAARARNSGYEKLLELHPEITLIQFVDSDCVVDKDWINKAQKMFYKEPLLAAVSGHQGEKNAHKNIYKKLFSIEWRSPVGIMKDYGGFIGNNMMRASVLKQVGGYNPQVIAGEDSELGVRLELNGYYIRKIDHAMTLHDADITRFNQWWKRSVRAGHAIGQRAHLNGNTALRDCVHARNSTWLWGIGFPSALLLALVPTNGLSAIASGMYLLLGFRMFRYRKNLGDNTSDAILYSGFTLIAKFANAIGLIKFYFNKAKGHYNLIEYK